MKQLQQVEEEEEEEEEREPKAEYWKLHSVSFIPIRIARPTEMKIFRKMTPDPVLFGRFGSAHAREEIKRM